MDMKWIKDFLYLVETQNFSAAAEKRFVTQSAFSRRIRALESWAGAELFDRNTLPITVTECGKKFLPYAEKILADLNQMEAKFHPLMYAKKREMRIITLHSLMLHFMPDCFMDFNTMDTKIRVTSNLNGLDSYLEQITTGTSDLFISYEFEDLGQRLLKLGHIKSFIVGCEDIVPIISPSLARKITWESAEKIPHLKLNRGAFLSDIVQNKISQYKDKLETVYEANLSESLMHMAKQGKGVAWLPYSVCKDEINQRSLAILKGPDLIDPSNIVAYMNTKNGGLVTSRFCRHMENLFKQNMRTLVR